MLKEFTLIPENTAQEIQVLLNKIEAEKGVSIIAAVESGSRAWGFPSKDSDFDIRFVYHHSPQWYITAFEKKDHISLAISHDLDAAGWDISKVMRLLYKGNATLHEWLNSPIVYRQQQEKTDALRELSARVFNPLAAFYHYISLAKKKLNDEKSATNPKSFLYGMRAVLCAKWIADFATAPPVLFKTLSDHYLNNESEKALAHLLDIKAGLCETDKHTVDASLYNYIVTLYEELKKQNINAKREGDSAGYDAVMRKILLDM